MNTDERRLAQRPTVRIVLLDDDDRVLLFRFKDDAIRELNGHHHRSFWVTPGGALESGEDYEAAAVRELVEETGFKKVEFSKWIWKRQVTLEWFGRPVLFDERYYLARTRRTDVCVNHLTGHERRVYRDYRWRVVDEVVQTDEVIFPKAIGTLLLSITEGIIPTQPITIE